MYIERRGTSYRVKRIIDGKSVRVSFDHEPTKREVESAFRQVAEREGSPNTFKECAREYIDSNDGSLRKTTIIEYEGKLRRLPESFLKTKICDITEAQVQRVVSQYAKTPGRTGNLRCQKTVEDFRGFIITILNQYGRKGFDINAVGAAPVPKYMPTEEDITRLLEHVKGTEIEVPILISAFASLREAELLALEMDDIKDGMIHVCKTAMWTKGTPSVKIINPYAKTDQSIRYSAIPKEVEEIIHKKGYIYPYRPNSLRYHFKKACKEVGIENIQFRVLRSYYASVAHYLGVPDKYIQKNGGWKNRSTLEHIYEKTLSDKQKEQDDILRARFSAQLGTISGKSTPESTP